MKIWIRLTLFSAAVLLAFMFSGCDAGPDYMTVREAARTYGWTLEEIEDYLVDSYEDSDFWRLCVENADEWTLIDTIANTYEPEEILAHSPYTDRVMAKIVLRLYRDEILKQLYDE